MIIMMMMTTMIMMILMMFLMVMMMILMMMMMMMSKIHPFSKIAVTLAPVEENLVYAAIWWSQMTTTRHGFSLKSQFR